MKILALEFSSNQRSVAVLVANGNKVEAVSEAVETGGRSTRALGMIEGALRQSQVEREEIECIAIGLGPGSYTGIRAAISVAQGWQFAKEVKLVGMSSAECLAAQAAAEGLNGRVAVVINAQRHEFYLAKHEVTPAGRVEVEPLRIASFVQVQACAGDGYLVIGPEALRWFPGARELVPRAAVIARLALGRTDFVPGEKLEPIYLRETAFVKTPRPGNLRQ